MGTFFNLQKQWGAEQATETLGWLPLVSLIVFFIAYSSGLANVPFIILGELFPANYRSVLGPISSSFNLICTFSVVRFYPSMKKGLGDDWTFFLFMIATLVGIAFIFLLVPETKGKTLEEIESIFSKKPHLHSRIESSPTDSKETEEKGNNHLEVIFSEKLQCECRSDSSEIDGKKTGEKRKNHLEAHNNFGYVYDGQKIYQGIFFLLPETKGKMLNEFEVLFANKFQSHARNDQSSQTDSTDSTPIIPEERQKKNLAEIYDTFGFVNAAMHTIYEGKSNSDDDSSDDENDDGCSVPVPF